MLCADRIVPGGKQHNLPSRSEVITPPVGAAGAGPSRPAEDTGRCLVAPGPRMLFWRR